MAEESLFRGVIDFLDKMGVYDIILPFILVFTIVFAVLEKTKVLGLEKIDGKDYTKKNLNSIVAFSVAFLVIASTQLVAMINQVMANVVLLIILAICFLMLVGVFMGDKEFTLKDYPGWMKFFMVLMFAGIVVIFLNAITIGENTLLEIALSIFVYWNETWAAAIIFLIVIFGFMFYIVREPHPKKEEKK